MKGATEPAAITLGQLRGWLALQSAHGRSRATIARRAASARAFTAWCVRRGLATTDPGDRLTSPQAGTTLPAVLDAAEAAALMDHAAVAADDALAARHPRSGDAGAALRHRHPGVGAVRVDVDDVDRSRRTVRVRGKGDKERTVPFGVPGEGAIDDWLARPAHLATRAGAALFVGARGGRIDPRTVRTGRASTGRRGRSPRSRPAWASAHRGDPCAGGRCGPSHRAGASRACHAGHDPAVHPCVGREAEGHVRPGAPACFDTGRLARLQDGRAPLEEAQRVEIGGSGRAGTGPQPDVHAPAYVRRSGLPTARPTR